MFWLCGTRWAKSNLFNHLWHTCFCKMLWMPGLEAVHVNWHIYIYTVPIMNLRNICTYWNTRVFSRDYEMQIFAQGPGLHTKNRLYPLRGCPLRWDWAVSWDAGMPQWLLVSWRPRLHFVVTTRLVSSARLLASPQSTGSIWTPWLKRDACLAIQLLVSSGLLKHFLPEGTYVSLFFSVHCQESAIHGKFLFAVVWFVDLTSGNLDASGYSLQFAQGRVYQRHMRGWHRSFAECSHILSLRGKAAEIPSSQRRSLGRIAILSTSFHNILIRTHTLWRPYQECGLNVVVIDYWIWYSPSTRVSSDIWIWILSYADFAY